ncbi:hypothetical protein HPB50_012235 [Hyalomma asiaticum]|uniref:Uncharacterized protein n=1 Tax=Hyalomma asiaticum TaxID=266040 RepID=A0ACB7RQM0_HYAAI|nr:hypothetical protein HPB50_012235 [Hyalomma asiaticum]
MSADDDVVATINIIVLVCSLLLRRRRVKKTRRRYWVRPCWRYRNLEGQARALLPRLRARDEGYFRDFLRMPPRTFDTLLGLVRPMIEHQDTSFRPAISAHDRLAITLRFTYVDIGHYGGESDGGIFSRTLLMEILEESKFGIPPPEAVGSAGLIPYLIVGDEAFPLKPYLMRPYPRRGVRGFNLNPPGYVDIEDWEGNVTDGAWRADHGGLPTLQDLQGCHPAR